VVVASESVKIDLPRDRPWLSLAKTPESAPAKTIADNDTNTENVKRPDMSASLFSDTLFLLVASGQSIHATLGR
jgi:hypothetical protein